MAAGDEVRAEPQSSNAGSVSEDEKSGEGGRTNAERSPAPVDAPRRWPAMPAEAEPESEKESLTEYDDDEGKSGGSV